MPRSKAPVGRSSKPKRGDLVSALLYDASGATANANRFPATIKTPTVFF